MEEYEIRMSFKVDLEMSFWMALKLRIAGFNAMRDLAEASQKIMEESVGKAAYESTKKVLVELGIQEEVVKH